MRHQTARRWKQLESFFLPPMDGLMRRVAPKLTAVALGIGETTHVFWKRIDLLQRPNRTCGAALPSRCLCVGTLSEFTDGIVVGAVGLVSLAAPTEACL